MDVLIRDLEAGVHAELTQRARAADMSLRAYLREVLCEHVAVPSIPEWLDHLHDLEPVTASENGAQLIAAARAEADVPGR